MQRLAPQADSSLSSACEPPRALERAAPRPGGTVSAGGRRAARGPERAVRDCPRPSPFQGVADVVRGPLSGVWGCVGARAPPPGEGLP